MEEFPSNSHTEKKPLAGPKKEAKTEAKKVERVTKGEVVRRKKPLGARFKAFFFNGDNIKTVMSDVVGEVLLPAARDMVADAGREGLERMIFGESRPRTRFRGGSPGHTPYNRYANTASAPPWQRDRPDPREVPKRSRSANDFGEIILESRGEAEEVIDQLIEIISQYQQASVADLYALVGITAAYTDQKYGWTDLRGANVSHVRGGLYLLNLPKPEPLD